MLRCEDEIRLIREPENDYDSKAIAVYRQQAKLGYIPRKSNFALTALLDQGETVKACISSIDEYSLPYGGVDIEIYLGVG